MKREEILAAYEAGPEAMIKLVGALMAIITELEERIKVLEAQLHKNSRNSSNPPSTDGFFKPKSQRQKSGKPVGG